MTGNNYNMTGNNYNMTVFTYEKCLKQSKQFQISLNYRVKKSIMLNLQTIINGNLKKELNYFNCSFYSLINSNMTGKFL